MKRDFKAELQAIIDNAVNRGLEPVKAVQVTYDIYKRSIPVKINRLVGVGLSREEATVLQGHLVRKEGKRRLADDIGVFFVYDIVASNATEEEQSVFFNAGGIVI